MAGGAWNQQQQHHHHHQQQGPAAAATPTAKAPLQVAPDSREIGGLAVWSVTSAKPGNGVELLRDDRDESYWQSDGPQPHLVNIQFQKKVRLHSLAVFLDYKLDESYTPHKMVVRCGTGFQDLQEVATVELEEPAGWTVLPLTVPGSSEPLKAYLVQLAVISNHQNGRDTHIRQVKVFGPRDDPVRVTAGRDISFTTPAFSMYTAVR